MRASRDAPDARGGRKGPLPTHSPKYRGKGPDERHNGHASILAANALDLIVGDPPCQGFARMPGMSGRGNG